MDLDRWVIVSALHGERFAGQIENGENGRASFLHAARNGEPVKLENVRLFLGHHGFGPGGEAGGIQTIAALIPLEVADGPIESLYVRPSSWYFIEDVPSAADKFERMMERAEKAEEENRLRQSAQRANISLPGVRRGPLDT